MIKLPVFTNIMHAFNATWQGIHTSFNGRYFNRLGLISCHALMSVSAVLTYKHALSQASHHDRHNL